MISKYRYCLTKSGDVVLADDVRAASLLVGEGCEVEEDVAKKYGFVNGEVKPKALPIESKEGDISNNIVNLTSKESAKPIKRK